MGRRSASDPDRTGWWILPETFFTPHNAMPMISLLFVKLGEANPETNRNDYKKEEGKRL
jgi:hypothetical protein